MNLGCYGKQLGALFWMALRDGVKVYGILKRFLWVLKDV
jgi:hypothetical protein